MTTFIQIAELIEANDRKVIDDQTGETVLLDGVGLLVQGTRETAVALWKNKNFYLRGLYIDVDGIGHIDEYTTGGAVYRDETPELLDLQWHPVMTGLLRKTWMFGHKDGGCVERAAPVVEKKDEKTKAANAKKDADKKDKKIEPTYIARPPRNLGLSSVSVPVKQQAAQASA